MSIAFSFFNFAVKYKISIIFYLIVFLFVYYNRKKFEVQSGFIYLYKTKFGISLMERISSKAKKTVKFFGYAGTFFGFLGMAVVFVMIVISTYKLIISAPGAGGASPVIPGFPIAGTGIDFPLVIGWIALFVIILVHEFSHGIVSLAHKVKIKSSGIAFFGPIMGAFVEPDEKKLMKQKRSVQNSVFAAGSFSNLILAAAVYFIAIPLLVFAVGGLVFSAGVIVSPQAGSPVEKAGLENLTVITKVNGINISDVAEFQNVMKGVGPDENITISSENQTYFVTTVKHPDDPSKGYLGIWLHGNKTLLQKETMINKAAYAVVVWIVTLCLWIAFISANIGLINLLPVFITDGARMLKIETDGFVKDKKQALSVWLGISWFCVMMVVILIFLPAIRSIATALM